MRNISSGPFHLLSLLAVCLAVGCARGPAKPEAKPLKQADLDAMIRKQASDDPVLRSQVDFGLVASPAGPDRVQVTVTNKTTHDIVVGPSCFALIPPGTRQTVKPNTGQSLKLFPLIRVRAGDQASGLLVFTPAPLPPGAKLVFIQPPDKPAMTLIH